MSKESGGGLIFLAAGIYGLIFSVPLPLGRWNQPGPGVFPLALSILLCVFGVFWLVLGRSRGPSRNRVGLRGVLRGYRTPVQIVGITAVYIVALEPLGYLLASTLYIFVLFAGVSRYRLWIAATLAVAFGAGSWLFFEKLLATPLPKGLLPF